MEQVLPGHRRTGATLRVSRTSTTGTASFLHPKENYIAILASLGIVIHLVLRYLVRAPEAGWRVPLYAALIFAGIPLVADLSRKLLARQFGPDLLAGISILTSVLLGEYLVGTIVLLTWAVRHGGLGGSA